VRIGFLTPEYPTGRTGGIGTSTAARAEALAAAGHHVVVTGPGPAVHEDVRGVAVRFDPVRHPPKLGWLTVPRTLQHRVRRLVEAERLDLVVAPDWLGLSAGVHPGCPVVVDGNGSATFFGDQLDEPVRSTVRLAERRAVRAAAGVTAVSAHLAARTQVLFDLPTTPTVLPNAVDTTRFPVADPARRARGRVLHLGTVVRKKGVLDVVAAFDQVAEALPAAHLQVVGRDAPDRSSGASSTWALAERTASPEARARTRSVGEVLHGHVVEHLATAQVLLVPSRAEAQPMAWLEAMATGLPVVAYDLPWAREVVQQGTTGLLVPVGDVDGLAEATIALLRDDDRRTAMGAAAADRVRAHFAITEVAARAATTWAQLAHLTPAGGRT